MTGTAQQALLTEPTCLKLDFLTVGNHPPQDRPTREWRGPRMARRRGPRPAPLPAGDVMVRGLTWPAHRSVGKRAGGAAGGPLPAELRP